jgi:GH25 family lysozyme M1 (1,4-beta-N-acetylmuramidase)
VPIPHGGFCVERPQELLDIMPYQREQLQLFVRGELDMIKGVDFGSVDRNKCDWAKAKADGVSFAICRAAYGDWKDTSFTAAMKGASDVGIARSGYLFIRPDQEIQPQVSTFCAAWIAEDDARNNDMRLMVPWIDIEYPTKKGSKKEGRASWGFTAQQAIDRSYEAWLLVQAETDMIPGIYTSARVIREDHDDLPFPEEMLKSPLWLAR